MTEVIYRIRYILVSFAVLALLLLTSTLVAAAGAHSFLATNSRPTTKTVNLGDPNNANVLTASGSIALEYADVGTTNVEITLYRTCRTINKTTSNFGSMVAKSGDGLFSAMGSGVSLVGHGASFAGRGITHGIAAAFRLPGKGFAAIAGTKAVASIVRPADTMQMQVPVIESQTSAEMLAQYDLQKQQQFAKFLDEQKVANENLNGTIITGNPAHGGYPAKWDNARQDSMLDSWGMYNRECVSYAAWKVNQTFGNMPYWGGVGNANQWIADAKAWKIPTSRIPRVHSVAISLAGHYGHAMWVEKVEGARIYVSQYNYNLDGRYSEMWVNSNQFTYIYF